MSLPEKLDDWFVDKFQKFSNWFRNETGKTCYWLARQFAVGSIASFALCVVFMIGLAKAMSVFTLLLALFIMNMCFKMRTFITLARSLDAKAERSETALSPLRPFEKAGWGRVMYCMMIVMLVIVTIVMGSEARTPDSYAFNAGFTLCWFSLYFLACTPQPRKPKKVKAAAPAFHALPQGA